MYSSSLVMESSLQIGVQLLQCLTRIEFHFDVVTSGLVSDIQATDAAVIWRCSYRVDFEHSPEIVGKSLHQLRIVVDEEISSDVVSWRHPEVALECNFRHLPSRSVGTWSRVSRYRSSHRCLRLAVDRLAFQSSSRSRWSVDTISFVLHRALLLFVPSMASVRSDDVQFSVVPC